jgi:hypothetical protein
VNPEEEGLYEDMRAAIRGDLERAEQRAREKKANPVPAPPPPEPEPERNRPLDGVRRLFGGRRPTP